MTQLERFVAARNADLLVDVLMKGGLGLLAAGLVFGFFWWMSFVAAAGLVGLRGAGSVALLVTGRYLAAATWSALREDDPLSGLPRLTAGERSRRELEDAVGELVGVDPLGLRRESIAGLAGCLLAGPQSLLGAWRAWRRRVALPADALAQAEALLVEAGAGAPVGGRELGALALVHLGLVSLAADDDGAVRANLPAKGKQVVAGQA